MTVHYYGMDGQPISRDEFIQLVTADSRRIGYEKRGDVTVSTVLVGIDLSFGLSTPLIFETMISGGDHDQKQWRYATRAEAEEGHRLACELAFEGGEAR